MTDSVNEQDLGLMGLIGQSEYQQGPADFGVTEETAPEADVQQGADSTPNAPTGEGLSPASHDTDTPPTGEQQQDLTPPAPATPSGNAQSPQYTPEQVEAMRVQLDQQQRYINMHAQQVAAENERRFRASLEEMDETERRAAIAEREAHKYRAQAQYLDQKMRTQEQQEQMTAKRTLATIVAGDNGLPVSLSTALLNARSLPEMESLADVMAADLRLGKYQPAAPAEEATPQVDTPTNPNAAFVAGGEAGSSNTVQPIEPGSGDLAGLIGQTSYQTAR